MGIIGWIILGLLAGAIAKVILPGDDPGGIIITGLIGIVGAVIGGLIAKALGFGDPIDEFFELEHVDRGDHRSDPSPPIYRLIVGRGTREKRRTDADKPEGHRFCGGAVALRSGGRTS